MWGSSSNETPAIASNNLWGAATDQSAAAADLWSSTSNKSSDSLQPLSNPFGGSDPFSDSSGIATPSSSVKVSQRETTFGASQSPVPHSQPSPVVANTAKPELEPVSQTRKCDIYKAQYDFEARNPDELTFRLDEKIKVSLMVVIIKIRL